VSIGLFGCENSSKNIIEQNNRTIDSLRQEISRLQYLYNKDQQSSFADDNSINSYGISNHRYSEMSKNELVEEFKDYMSDNYFEVESFKISGDIIRVQVGIVMNISVRKLERENPSLFNALLSSYSKIVFWDQFGKSVTLTEK
jgi:hypothetical protein